MPTINECCSAGVGHTYGRDQRTVLYDDDVDSFGGH